MKSLALDRGGVSTRSAKSMELRAVCEVLESRRLLSAVDLSGAPEGLRLDDGGWLFANSNGTFSKTKPDGSLDTSFGKQGVAAVSGVNFQGQYMDRPVNPFALADNGNILVAGGDGASAVVARFHPDGSLDTTFGDNGLAKVPLFGDPYFFALALQSDGKIVAAGESWVQNSNDWPIRQITVARFSSDGSIDKSFNDSGVVSAQLPGTKEFGTGDQAEAVAIQKDGKILAGGMSSSTTGWTNPVWFGLIRLNADGTLDKTFGSGGEVVTHFKDAEPSSITMDRAEITSLFVRDDGTILAVGSGQNRQVLAAAYNADGSLDTTWGIGGRLLVENTSGAPEHTQLTSDGGFQVFEHNSDSLALTIGSDGKSPDPTPVDPTPVASADPVQTPDPGSTPPINPPAPPGVIPNTNGGQGTGTVSSSPNTGSVPPHLALHSVHVHHAVQGETFDGKLAVAVNLDAASLKYSIDFGDGSPTSTLGLIPDAKHPSHASIFAGNVYQAPGVYVVKVTLFHNSVAVRTLTEKIRVVSHSSNGRLIHATAGKMIEQTFGTILSSQMDEGSAFITTMLLDWGDGSSSIATTSKRDQSILAVRGGHAYQHPGTYVVKGILDTTRAPAPPGVVVSQFLPAPAVLFVTVIRVQT